MTLPLPPPAKKDPQELMVSPTQAPHRRSRAALGLSAAAAEGRFMLQICAECGTVQYPPRDACRTCLAIELTWTDVPPEGMLLAETTLETSINLYFRQRAPWRIGSVKLDVGPVIICHVHADVTSHGPVILRNRLDQSGQGVLMAVPPQRSPNMQDDPQMRTTTCDPKHRRILITDGRSPTALALASDLVKAGASTIFVGEAENWRPNPHRPLLEAEPKVHLVRLDVTDTNSVAELAGQIGGKVDILINNARFIRPGGVLARSDTGFAHIEMATNYFGLMRLAQSFGPGMCARTADGVNSAVAWVNMLSVYAVMNASDYGCFSASNAAALSLSQSLRAEFRPSGLRVINVFFGPNRRRLAPTHAPT